MDDLTVVKPSVFPEWWGLPPKEELEPEPFDYHDLWRKLCLLFEGKNHISVLRK